MEKVPNDTSDFRIDWIEPAIDELDVNETAGNRGRGADGNLLYVDCTRS